MLDQRYELRHLNDDLALEIRRLMVAELHWSLQHGKLYYSKHFTVLGRKQYPLLLEKALIAGNPDTLEESLNVAGYFKQGTPRNAAQIFSWDEFNKYYMRALCLLAQILQECDLLVVRGRHSTNPKPESDRLVGTTKGPLRFLTALRQIPKVNPFGANSGLTSMIRKRKLTKTG